MNERIKLLISKYLIGTATKEDREILLQWVNETSANKKQLSEIESIWNAIEIIQNRKTFDHKSAWDIFDKKLKALNSPYEFKHLKPIQNPVNFYKLIISAAAVIILLLGISTVYFYTSNQDRPQNSIVYNEISVPFGSISKIKLGDSSVVWLNAGSKFTYPNQFGNKTRDVMLEGEAYFEVAKNPQKPFIVKTNTVDIKVLGTSFNLISYPDDKTVEMTLITGKALVENTKGNKDNFSYELKPKQKAIILKENKSVMLSTVETKDLVSWKEGKLVFVNEPFEIIAKKIERYYNVKISFNKELAKHPFTGTFTKEDKIEKMMEIFSLSKPIKYEIKNNEVKIRYLN